MIFGLFCLFKPTYIVFQKWTALRGQFYVVDLTTRLPLHYCLCFTKDQIVRPTIKYRSIYTRLGMGRVNSVLRGLKSIAHARQASERSASLLEN